MPKPIDQINQEFQAKFKEHKRNESQTHPQPEGQRIPANTKIRQSTTRTTPHDSVYMENDNVARHNYILPKINIEQAAAEQLNSNTKNRPVNWISFLDTNPNGLTLPPQYLAERAEQEHSAAPPIKTEKHLQQRKKVKKHPKQGKKVNIAHKKKKPLTQKRAKRRLTFLVPGILILLSALTYFSGVLIYYNQRNDIFAIFGYFLLPQMTDNMKPEIEQDSLLVIKTVDNEDLNIGDNIVIKRNRAVFVTRKIVSIYGVNGISERRFITCVLNEYAEDADYFNITQIKGRVELSIPKLGRVLLVIANNLLVVGSIFVSMIILIQTLKSVFSSE